MHYFFFDASALIKRYHHETGSGVVNLLLDALLPSISERVIISPLIVSETISVLSRDHNAGRIPPELFKKAATRLLFETRSMNHQSIDDETILQSIPLINRHNLNASDALYLHQALNLSRLLQTVKNDLVIVASDLRLLRAGSNEGLLVFNPEEASIADAETLLHT